MALLAGAFQVISVLTSALGPLVLSLCKEFLGTYDAMFRGIAPLALGLAVAAIWVPMPERPVLPPIPEPASEGSAA